MAHLKITDASGRQWQFGFVPQAICTIGRAPDNAVVLDDPRASRYHAHIKAIDGGVFTIVDGAVINGQLRRSANKVFINGEPHFEQQLKNGDRITIGASTLRFEQPPEERTTDVRYDDKPLGHTAPDFGERCDEYCSSFEGRNDDSAVSATRQDVRYAAAQSEHPHGAFRNE